MLDPIPAGLTYVGIRAHHIRFPRRPDQGNIFPGWIAAMTVVPRSVSISRWRSG